MLAPLNLSMKTGLSAIVVCPTGRHPEMLQDVATEERPNAQDRKIPAVWQALFSSSPQIDWFVPFRTLLACRDLHSGHAGAAEHEETGSLLSQPPHAAIDRLFPLEGPLGCAVLRALASHRRARVTSTPRVLVNDNSTGTLASVTEVPFTSVNASNTVATTSFAGFAEAGTTIEVTPRISEDDHLMLDYTVTLNSFTGAGSAGVPPPRQTDEVRSTVTIPDGHTVIVGGLNRTNSSIMQDGIPFIEFIPVLRELTSTTTTAKSRSTLFVFLRPVILRDDKFRDLRYVSDKALKCAGCQENYPASSPMLVR